MTNDFIEIELQINVTYLHVKLVGKRNIPKGTSIMNFLNKLGISDFQVEDLVIIKNMIIANKEDILNQGDKLVVLPTLVGG